MMVINIDIICKGRCKGKTHDLILESARTGIPILTAYDSRYIVDQARYMGVKINQPMNIKEYMYYKSNNSLENSPNWSGKLLLDEVDIVLEKLLNAHIEMVTCTPNNYKEKGERSMNMKDFIGCYNGTALLSTWDTKPCIKIDTNPSYKFELTKSGKLILGIKDVNIIVPNKVVEVTFEDGTKEKSVCKEPDVFSLEMAISICVSKKLMGGSNIYNNTIKRGMKIYNSKKKKEAEDKAEQERIERKRAKKKIQKERRIAKRAEMEKERQIEIQKEAYVRAMQYMEEKKNLA